MFRDQGWMIRVMCVAVAVCACAGRQAQAATIFVDDSAPSGGNGSSWSQAHRSLRTALQQAQSGDTVRVARGTYRPAVSNGNRIRTFKVPEGVVVQGGYAGYGASNPNKLNPSIYKTILSGDLNQNDGPNFANASDNSYHVVTFENVTTATQLRGVTIRGGNADVNEFDSPNASGAGVRIVGGGGPKLNQCIIRNNRATMFGAGLDAPDAAPILIACTIRDNETVFSTSGGGAGVNTSGGKFKRCAFSNNHGPNASASGGGIRGQTIDVIECTFTGNISSGVFCSDHSLIQASDFIGNASEDGGGIYISGQNVGVIDCLFHDNAASSFGGAVYVAPGGSSTIINSGFYGNLASSGMGVANSGSLEAVNCVFSGHVMDFGAVATILNQQGDTTLTNCTIAHNRTGDPGAGLWNDNGTTSLHNCILWANNGGQAPEAAQLVAMGGSININFSCVQGWTGALAGEGNSGANAGLKNPKGADNVLGTPDDDMRLKASSTCRDAGDSSALPQDIWDIDDDGDFAEPIPLDLDFEARTAGSAIDLGAYEF